MLCSWSWIEEGILYLQKGRPELISASLHSAHTEWPMYQMNLSSILLDGDLKKDEKPMNLWAILSSYELSGGVKKDGVIISSCFLFLQWWCFWTASIPIRNLCLCFSAISLSLLCHRHLVIIVSSFRMFFIIPSGFCRPMIICLKRHWLRTRAHIG